MRATRQEVIVAFPVQRGLRGADVRATGLQSGDDQLIREARARSNQAIAAHDLAGIARVWMGLSRSQ
jgi:hypothetical protein